MTLATTDTATTARKRERFRLHHFLQTESVRGGARTCMTGLGATVRVARSSAGAVHVSGVARCASVWACPVCAPTIRDRRAAEIDAAVTRLLGQGYRVAFVTATVQHSLGDSLAQVYGLVQAAWSGVFSGRGGVTLRQSGYVGQCRVIEVTHGGNGWHPHVHALLVFRPGIDPAPVMRAIGSRFSLEVRRLGGFALVDDRLERSPGWDWSPVTVAADVSSYLSKVADGWGAGLELARGDLKAGRGRSPFQLLADGIDGDTRALGLWRMYEEVTRGRMFVRWTRGLRDLAGVDEVSDEEAAAGELDDDLAAEWLVPVQMWNAWRRAGRLGDLLVYLATAPPGVVIT